MRAGATDRRWIAHVVPRMQSKINLSFRIPFRLEGE